MKKGLFTIKANRAIAPSIFCMDLSGDTSAITAPGQFVNVEIEGLYLRRPISVCDYDNGALRLIYKVVGAGTERMSRMEAGKELDLLTGLGNDYNIEISGSAPLLIGGGVGIPPLYALAKQLTAQKKQVQAVLGYQTAADLFLQEEFEKLGAKVTIVTNDGSCGKKGFVTDALPETYSAFYACGPEPMLRAVCEKTSTTGQLSFEERMGCGFGACMGCTCKTKYGYKRICKDGPVLQKEEIIW